MTKTLTRNTPARGATSPTSGATSPASGVTPPASPVTLTLAESPQKPAPPVCVSETLSPLDKTGTHPYHVPAMSDTFTKERGLEVQARHLEEWRALLNDRAYAELTRLVEAENAGLPDGCRGYDVRRGLGLGELVTGQVLRAVGPAGPRARVVPHTLAVSNVETAPDGVRWLTVSAPLGWEDVVVLTDRVLEYDGRHYAYSGWNSDRNVAYFRTGAPVARVS